MTVEELIILAEELSYQVDQGKLSESSEVIVAYQPTYPLKISIDHEAGIIPKNDEHDGKVILRQDFSGNDYLDEQESNSIGW